MIETAASDVKGLRGSGSTLDRERRSQVRKICIARAQGYREVLITVLVAWIDGVEFDPCNGNFYECSPRAVFEQGIRPALIALGLKSRKSGPLNVAKAQRTLDEDWARSREDPDTALNVVALLKWAKQNTARRATPALHAVLEELIAEAQELSELSVAPPTALSATQAANRALRLIELAPNAGNTAQAVVHAVVSTFYEGTGACIDELGRASETNLTAKKAADVTVRGPWSRRLHLYEVTTKIIDSNRIRDSDESVLAHGDGANCVTWICRMPENVEGLLLDDATLLSTLGIRHEFVDIRSWLLVTMELLGEERRDRCFVTLIRYINDGQTDRAVKEAWLTIHTGSH